MIGSKAKKEPQNRTTVALNDEKLLEWLGVTAPFNRPISEITYFTCLKMLSETVGKMPIKFYAKGRKEAEPNSAFYLLKYRPNPQMTPTTFWTAVENNRNHFGNAYVWIQAEFNKMKYGGDYKIKSLWVMPSNDVTVIVDDKGIFGGKGKLYYWYTDKYSGESYLFPEYEVMHFKTSTTFDGITGESVRSILKATIDGALASQNFKNKLYEGGLTARAALQYTGDLDPKKEKALIAKLKKAFLMVAGSAVQKYGTDLHQHQQLLMAASDMLIEIYMAESGILRTEKLVKNIGEANAKEQIAMAKLYLYQAVDIIYTKGKEGIVSFAQEDEQRMMLMGLRRFTKYNNQPNVIELKEIIATKVIADNKYSF